MDADYYLDLIQDFKNEVAKELSEAAKFSMTSSQIEDYRTCIGPYLDKVSLEGHKIILSVKQLTLMKYHETKIEEQQRVLLNMEILLITAANENSEHNESKLLQDNLSAQLAIIDLKFKRSLAKAVDSFRFNYIEELVKKNKEFDDFVRNEREIERQKKYISLKYGITESERPVVDVDKLQGLRG